MAAIKSFESNEAKLDRLKKTHLERCDELDKKLNQMDLKYKYIKPAADGLKKGDLKDVDAILGLMADMDDAFLDVEKQERKMGIDPDANKPENGKLLEKTVRENLY